MERSIAFKIKIMSRNEMYTKSSIRFLALTLVLAVAHPLASAQNYPTKPVRLITPTGAGGSLDTMARIIAAKLT